MNIHIIFLIILFLLFYRIALYNQDPDIVSEAIEGKEIVNAKKSMMGEIIEISDNNETKIMENMYAITTPGHTSGHISFVVKSDESTVLIAGDQTMTKEEYCDRKFSRWYPEENLKQLNESLDKAQSYKPDLVIPGHDRAFKPN